MHAQMTTSRKISYFAAKLGLGLAIAGTSGIAAAQGTGTPGFNWGMVVGISVENAVHCNVDSATRDAFVMQSKKQMESVYGPGEPDYKNQYDAGVKRGIDTAQKMIARQGGKGPMNGTDCALITTQFQMGSQAPR